MSHRDRLLGQVRRIALQGTSERRTDGQLLEHFISERDEAAFALLVRRHGPMVWSVCRRVLGNVHDADDAFQAAFLVLVRKADSIRPREAVGNWLYGVAYRTALEARGRIARRRAKERSLQEAPSPESGPEENDRELLSALDRELSRLSDKYRLPIVLCDLEGHSRQEVAQQLAIPEGTLSSRLATGRKKLAARLTRLGFTLTGASLAALLAENAATAGMAASLFTTTTKAALLIAAGPIAVSGVVSTTVSTLTEGVLKTMLIAKIKTAALVLCGVAALGIGTGGVYFQTLAGAADSPRETQSDPKPSSNAIGEPERSADDWKRIAEDLRRQLSAEREKANKSQSETAALRAEIEAMKKEALARQQRAQVPLGPLAAFEQAKAQHEQLVNEHRKRFDALRKKQRELLDMQLQQFEKQRRQNLAEVDKLIERIGAEQAANQPNTTPSHKPTGGDKPDPVLERLERLEKRLDRLEKDRK